MDFYNGKLELIKVAKKLFTYKLNLLTGDIDLEGKFDEIGYDIYGAASLSPKEYMERENLNYQRDEQGRDYFNTFLTLVIQFGVFLGYKEKEKEIKDLKEKLEFEKMIGGIRDREQEKLRQNQMPSGDLESEIIKLRNEVLDLKRQLQDVSIYERVIKTMVTSLNFDKKRV
jgi:hypothetical protein